MDLSRGYLSTAPHPHLRLHHKVPRCHPADSSIGPKGGDLYAGLEVLAVGRINTRHRIQNKLLLFTILNRAELFRDHYSLFHQADDCFIH